MVPRKKGMCKIKGHYHKIKDCFNNPKSKKYCGIPNEENMKCKEVVDDISCYEEGSIINDDTMPTNDDDDHGQSVTPETDDRFVPVPLANETTDSNAGNTKMTSNY